MLRNFLIPAMLILTIHANGQHNLFNSTDSTTVTGKIDGYSTNQEQQLVSYYVYDISGEKKKYFTSIEKDGKFSFRLLQQYEGEFGLQYGAVFVYLYSKPGERIGIKIDHNVADKPYYFPGAFKIDGSSASISAHMLKFFAQYLPILEERVLVYDLKLPNQEFTDRVHRFLQIDLDLLNKYINKNRPSEVFINWTKNYLIYEAARLIISKPFMGRDFSGATDTELLMLLKEIRILNEKALNNVSYYSFLSSWVGGIHMITGNGHDPADRDIAANEALNKIDGYLNGITREIAYLDSYIWNASSELAAFRLEQVWECFDSIITNYTVQQALEAKRNSLLQRFTPYSITDRIRKLAIDSSLSKNLLLLLEKEKGHFVYVYFWGTWCAPCMADMPYYRSFIEQFKDYPVHFLFLGVRTTDHDSKAVQQKYSIPGTFIVLNSNETSILNEVLNFTSYPSRFFIDPNGNLITKNVRSLNRKDASNLLKMLIKKYNPEPDKR